MWINIWVFDSIQLVNFPVFMPVPSCFHYCHSVIELDVRDGDASGSPFIVQDCFGYPGFFAFPYEVEYCSFDVLKNFSGHCIEYVDCFG